MYLYYILSFLIVIPLLVSSNEIKITSMQISCNVTHRYAKTTVVAKIRNFFPIEKNVEFSLNLPKTAFISGFIMELNKVNYTSFVGPRSAGTPPPPISSARDSELFTVSVKVEAEKTAIFYLWYEELLVRKNGLYEILINLFPGQIVENLLVTVRITEDTDIKNIQVPQIRSGNNNNAQSFDLSSFVYIENTTSSSVIVRFYPNHTRQQEIINTLGTKVHGGLEGQYVVQYDVDRNPLGSQLLFDANHFIHFFAATNLEPIPKHIVFILDASTSMAGDKMAQLQTAMRHILDQLNDQDLFHIVEFDTEIKVINIDDVANSPIHEANEIHNSPASLYLPASKLAASGNIQEAKTAINNLYARGWTDIYSALKVGLLLVQQTAQQYRGNEYREPIVVFLTDGKPSIYETNSDNILEMITKQNSGMASIFTISFGNDADKNFLDALALFNKAFTKHIYAASDAPKQLQDFYKQIASPVLLNVDFVYPKTATQVTKRHFPVYFNGTEIVVAGLTGHRFKMPHVSGTGTSGSMTFMTQKQKTSEDLERFWSYIIIQQLIEESKISPKRNELLKAATDIALQYSFVTPLTSLSITTPGGGSFVTNVGPPFQGTKFQDWMLRYFQSPVSTTTTTLRPPLHDLLTTLSWLNTILDSYGVLKTIHGNYKLGLNATITNVVDCDLTPLGVKGVCKLLHDCPQLHYYLRDINRFNKYFCDLNGFAGICCPKFGK